jgi:tRNA (cmo5U34)-methyltransferase
MLAVAAAAVPRRTRSLVDLGTGTGSLAQRCLQRAPRSRVLGIDADADILKLAARRLGRRSRLLCGSFARTPLPACDAVVASFALHHIQARSAKAQLYRRIRAALRPGGVFLSVDCHPAANARLARTQRQAWHRHLLASYTRKQAGELLASWAHEDTYVPLEAELRLLRQSGLKAEVLWRKEAFAVLMGLR